MTQLQLFKVKFIGSDNGFKMYETVDGKIIVYYSHPVVKNGEVVSTYDCPRIFDSMEAYQLYTWADGFEERQKYHHLHSAFEGELSIAEVL